VTPADPADRSAVAPAPLFAAGGRQLMFGIVAVILLIAFEAMAVATAMPRAVAELHGLAFYAWAFSGYVVASLFAMVVAGEVCDARGPRLPLLSGVALFTVGLVVAGTAVDMGVFVLGRALQGLGGGAVIVAIYVVVARAYDEHVRPRVFAVMSSAWVLPSIIGPAVAGFVADRFSWRWVFLGVPIFVVPAVLVMWRALPALEGGQPTSRAGRKRAALFVAAGVACLQYAGQRLDLLGLVFLAAGVALLAPSLHRLLPRGTIRFARGLPTVIAMRGVLAGSFFGAETFIPLMLVSERHISTTAAGLSLTGGAVGWAAGSWFQGRPSNTVPRDRLVRIGCVLVAVAIAGIALVLLPSVPPYVASLAWMVGGAGMGMAMASVALLMLQLSPEVDQGANSAAIQVSDALFSVLFIGFAGAIYAAASRHQGSSTWAFWVIDGMMIALALAGAAVSSRIRTGATHRADLGLPESVRDAS
jgi:MFS family permease